MNAPRRALISATAIGTILQLAMVLVGHAVPAVAGLFALGGMTISLVAGAVFALLAEARRTGLAVGGGAVAGGACALIGIAVSWALGDVPAVILAFGTVSSAVTGALGGGLGMAYARRTASTD